MISSNRRPNLVLRKDRAAKQLLLPTSCSLPPFREAMTKTLNATIHSKPRSNMSSLHQRDRCQPKYMRTVSLDKNPTVLRPERGPTMTTSSRLPPSSTKGCLLINCSAKQVRSTRRSALSWTRHMRSGRDVIVRTTPNET